MFSHGGNQQKERLTGVALTPAAAAAAAATVGTRVRGQAFGRVLQDHIKWQALQYNQSRAQQRLQEEYDRDDDNRDGGCVGGEIPGGGTVSRGRNPIVAQPLVQHQGIRSSSRPMSARIMSTAARAQQQQHAVPKRPVSARPSLASVYSKGGGNGKPTRRTFIPEQK